MYPSETTNRQDAHEVAAWAYEVQDDSLSHVVPLGTHVKAGV